MIIVKKLLSLLLVLLVSIGLFGCQNTEIDIALVIYDYKDLYMQDFEQLIYDANDSNVYTLTSYDSQNSQIIQNDIINNILEERPKLIIINPVDRLGVYPIIEKAREYGVAIVFINREPVAGDLLIYKELYYVGAKPEQSAIYQADIIMELFGENPNSLNEYDLNQDGKIQTIILKGQPGHQDAEIRTDRVLLELEENGYQVDILQIQDAFFSHELAYEKMIDLIATYGTDIELVIANNDAMALGAIEALIEHELILDSNENDMIDVDEPWIPVVGIDGLPIALNYIDTGYLAGTVINDSQTMAEAIHALVTAIVEGQLDDFDEFTIVDDTYIWIDYKTYTPTE